jgi:UDP:flavonoid glycosyltransferase YjiC (YdhE family)
MGAATKVELLVCTLGTRGDILPFLALCRPFIEDGHRVTVLTNANWQDLVEGIGAQFQAIADPDPSQSNRDDRHFYRTNTYPSFARSFSFIEERIARNRNCALIYRTNMLGAECAAEKHRIPNVKIALQPSAIRSSERPPWPLTSWACGPFAWFAKRWAIPAVYKLGEIATEYREHTNRFRARVGLRRIAFGKRLEEEDVFLILCPEWFAMPQKDWPASARLTGFLYFDDNETPDGELDAFIGAHGAPLVFTPGTGVSDVGRFFRLGVDVCERLGLPGLFLSPALRKLGPQHSGRILVRDYISFDRLLPRARMLVHHGGIGSVAQAIRAGIPQVVVPDRFDQPDNALRIALLGLGGAVFCRHPTAPELAGFIQDVLGSSAVRKQVETGANLVGAYPSGDVAYRLIHRMLDKRFGTARLRAVGQTAIS